MNGLIPSDGGGNGGAPVSCSTIDVTLSLLFGDIPFEDVVAEVAAVLALLEALNTVVGVALAASACVALQLLSAVESSILLSSSPPLL